MPKWSCLVAYGGASVTIPFGGFGLISDLAQTDRPAGSFLFARNITVNNGCAQKAPGTIKLNANALSAGIVALFDWWPITTLQRTIAVTSDGKVYRDEGSGGFAAGVPITTGLGTLTPNCVFVSAGQETAFANRKLFLFTEGRNQLKVLSGDGIAFTSITAPSADWTAGHYPTTGNMHRSRLWAFAGQRYYASDTADHSNFATNFLAGSVYPGEGGEIRAAFVFKGRLFAFKDGGFVYGLIDTDSDSDNWYWQRIAANFGLSAPNGIIEVLNDMLAGNTNGTVTSYSASFALGNIEAADIFKDAGVENYIRENTSRSGLLQQHALYYAEKKQAFFTSRSGYRTSNDVLICVDYGRQIPRVTLWLKGTPQCLALRKDENEIQRPMYGDASGYIHLMDREDRLEGAASYVGAFQTQHLDFRFAEPALANKQKNFNYLSVTYIPESSGNLSCDYYIDGRFVETLSFPMIQDQNSQLNTLLLNTDRLSQVNQETFTNPLKGLGRTISFYFYNSGSNQSFQVCSITVGFKPAGEQAQKVA